MADQNRRQSEQEYDDESQRSQDSSERDQSNREPASLTDDRGPGRDSFSAFSDDLESDKLESDTTIDDIDDDSDGSGRSNR